MSGVGVFTEFREAAVSAAGGDGGVLATQRISVRAPRRSRGHSLLRVVPAVLMFFALAAQLYVRLEVVAASYRLEQLRATALRNDARLRELRLQKAERSSPAELTQRANFELSMVAVPPQRVRRVPVN